MYAVVFCGQQSRKSQIRKKSLSPRWKQTLHLDPIMIYGRPEAVSHAPPSVVVKLYDKDTIVSG